MDRGFGPGGIRFFGLLALGCGLGVWLEVVGLGCSGFVQFWTVLHGLGRSAYRGILGSGVVSHPGGTP